MYFSVYILLLILSDNYMTINQCNKMEIAKKAFADGKSKNEL